MANEGYNGVPEVAAEVEAPNDYQHIEANPNAFGAQVGQGIEAAGQGVIDATKFYGQVSADNATNNFLQQATNLLHGDPNIPGDTGYYGKRGADAMDARADTAQSLDHIIQEQREGLSTPQAKLEFDTQSRRFRAQYEAQMGEYADGQQRVWATHTNQTSADIALNEVARPENAANPIAAGAAQMRVRQAYVKNAMLAGEDSSGAVLKADQDVTLARLRSLIVSDPQQAQHVLDKDGASISGLPNYDQISRAVKGAVIDATMAPAIDHAVAQAQANAVGRVGFSAGAPDAAALKSVFLGQESHNNPNAATSITGAVGPGQIEPDTFKHYARPGELITDPAANRAVSGRIIDDYVKRFDGDPARVAVAYFSGPGNVAPAGSPTPWLHDSRDPTGKSVSSYVGDIQARLTKYPSTADALNANMSQNLDRAQSEAERLFPNYPDAQARYVNGVRLRLDQTISQQHQQYEVDTHTVQAVMAGPKPPISEQELLATSPQVASAWQSMQINNPYGAMSVERMFDANAKGRSVTFGTNFKDYLDRALAPADHADRITNPSQLWGFVGTGNDAPLTNTGVNQLSDLLTQRGTPQGEAFAAQAKTFVDQMHGQLTFGNRAVGRLDPKGEALFSRFMVEALPIMTKAQQQGNLAQVLNPKSPDYLGNVAAHFMRTPAQIMKDRLADVGASNAPVGPIVAADLRRTLGDLDNDDQRKEALKDAVARKRISVRDATLIGQDLGYIKRADGGQGDNPLAHITVQPQGYPGGIAP